MQTFYNLNTNKAIDESALDWPPDNARIPDSKTLGNIRQVLLAHLPVNCRLTSLSIRISQVFLHCEVKF